jgi:hypothetical protein
MSVLNPQKTYKNLRKKGFVDSITKSDDHKYIELFHENRLVLYTKISHGKKDIGDPIIKAMAFQCKLSKTELMNLATCPLSKEDYLKILKEKGLLK